MTKIINGVDVDKLISTIDVIKKDQKLANFKFRSDTEWINGGYSKTKIQGFYGAGAEDESRKEPFIIETDEPQILLGTNKGPNAVEMVLTALASCLSVGLIYNAAARGIEIKSLKFSIEGDIDLHAFLGLSGMWGIETRPGYQDIKVNYSIESDASKDVLEELCEYVQKTSPVLDIISNKVPVTINME
jgi:uncharacterized OsmC-like protein